MASLRAGRIERIEAMVARLRGAWVFDRSATPSCVPSPAPTWAGAIWPITWRERGQVADTREVFARYLGDGCPACVDKTRLDSGQAIELINGSWRRRRAGPPTA